MGGRGRVRCAAFAPTKTARKRGRDRGKLAAIILCFEVGCVALALSYSSPFSLAERRRRRPDDGTTDRRLSSSPTTSKSSVNIDKRRPPSFSSALATMTSSSTASRPWMTILWRDVVGWRFSAKPGGEGGGRRAEMGPRFRADDIREENDVEDDTGSIIHILAR